MALRDLLVKLDVKVAGAEALDRLDVQAAKVAAGFRRMAPALNTAKLAMAAMKAQAREATKAAAAEERALARTARAQMAAQKAREKASAKEARPGQAMSPLGGYLTFGAILMAGRAVKNFITDIFESASALEFNAQRLGMTTDELLKYEFAAKATGMNVKETAVAFRFFNRAVGEAHFGTKTAVNTFARLGVNIYDANHQVKPTGQLMLEASDAIHKVGSQADRTAYAMRLFGRNGSALLPAFQKGGAEMRRFFSDMDAIGTKHTTGLAKAMNSLLPTLGLQKHAWREVTSAVGEELVPMFVKLKNNSMETAKKLLYFIDHTYMVRTALLSLKAALLGIVIAYTAVKMALGVADPALLAARAALVVLATAAWAVYVVFDDLFTFMAGGDSLLGRALGHEQADKLRAALQGVIDILQPASDAAKGLSEGLREALVDSIPWLIKWGGQFSVWVVNTIDDAVTNLRNLGLLLGGVGSAITGGDGWSKAMAEMDQNMAELKIRRAAYVDAMNALNQIGTGPGDNGPGGYGASARQWQDANGNFDFTTPMLPRNVSAATGLPDYANMKPPTQNFTINVQVQGGADAKETGKIVGTEAVKAVGGAVMRNAQASIRAGQPTSEGSGL